MGEAPELRGFFLGCGFNSAGEGAPDGERRWWCGDGEACGAGFSPAGRCATLSTQVREQGGSVHGDGYVKLGVEGVRRRL